MEAFIKGFFEAVVLQNKKVLRTYFCEEAIIRWHCSNECFTVEEYLVANCEYPGKWEFELKRCIEMDNRVITVARVYSDEMSCHVTSFIQMENEKIRVLDEYFGDDGLAPQWRLDKKIGKPIKKL